MTNVNKHIAVLEIQNVLSLYENNNSKEIGELLEISHDLPIGNIQEDAKTLINLILESNEIEDKKLILDTCKVLSEGVFRDAINIPEKKNKMSTNDLITDTENVIKKGHEEIENKNATKAGEAAGEGAENIAELSDRVDYYNQKVDDIDNMDKSELTRFKSQIQNASTAMAGTIVYSQILDKINGKLNSMNRAPGAADAVAGASNPGIYNKVRDFVVNHKGAIGATAAVAGIAGLGYYLWKKYKGDGSKALAALQSKKASCKDDKCKTAVDKEIQKIKNKG